jgi:hypothetical protein
VIRCPKSTLTSGRYVRRLDVASGPHVGQRLFLWSALLREDRTRERYVNMNGANTFVQAALFALFLLLAGLHLVGAVQARRNQRAWFLLQALMAVAMVNMLMPPQWMRLTDVAIPSGVCTITGSTVYVLAVIKLAKLRRAGREVLPWVLLALDAICTVWMYTFVQASSTMLLTFVMAICVMAGAATWLISGRHVSNEVSRERYVSLASAEAKRRPARRERAVIIRDHHAAIRAAHAISALGMAAMLIVMSPAGVRNPLMPAPLSPHQHSSAHLLRTFSYLSL